MHPLTRPPTSLPVSVRTSRYIPTPATNKDARVSTLCARTGLPVSKRIGATMSAPLSIASEYVNDMGNGK